MDKGWYPYSVNIELTLACNMRCLHCGSTAGKARRGELTREEYGRLFRGLADLGCSEVCLLGGEPFLRKDWYGVAGDAAQAGLKLIFITNGLAVRESVVRKLRRLGAVDRIGVSIDGPTADVHERIRGRKGSFDKAWRTARRLRDSGFETGIITTVSKINLESLGAMKDLIAGQSFTWQIQTAAPQGKRFDRKHVLSPVEFYETGRLISRWRNTIPVEDLPVCGSHDFGYFSKTLTRYAELPDWNGCGAGIYTLGVMSDGRVKGCLCQHDDFIEAHVRERGIEEIWNDERLFARNRRFRIELLEGDCSGCRHGSVCRAGCSNLSYTMTGSTYNNPYCFHRLERLGLVKGRGRRRAAPSSGKTGPRGFSGRKVP
jgi:radical SAM protein with 4Fe4S-binding SPASM domain